MSKRKQPTTVTFDQEPTQSSTPAARGGLLARPQSMLLGCIAALIALSTLLLGLALGFAAGRWSDGSAPAVIAGPPATGARSELDTEFGIFWEAMDLLYRDYYGERPAPDDATYGAIRGVLSELDDPNTSFMTPEEAQFFRESLEGSFEGIGARVEWVPEFQALRVTEPFENQPAWNAGVRRNDLITHVDGESLEGSNLSEGVNRIRGDKGTTVTLTLVREGVAEPFDVEVVRDRIETPTIATERLGPNGEIAYLQLTVFNEQAGTLVEQAVQRAQEEGAAAMILDLRGNTGGLLREAVKVASVFLEDQVVLYERFSDGGEEVYRTTGESDLAADVPLVVLVNGGSASASEIVAGALQDAGRATLVGETTFGKGSVQLPHSLSDGSIMRVTVARWFTPDNRSIDGVGLAPDVLVELTEEQRAAAEDPQLDRAVDLLSAGS